MFYGTYNGTLEWKEKKSQFVQLHPIDWTNGLM